MQTQTTKTPAAPNATRANEQKAATEKKAAAVKEPKVDPVLAKTVHLVAEKNPKREGSKSHARFALYKNGMTAESYVEAAVKLGQSRRAARADLTWDVDHKFIELKDAVPTKK